ncbi:MAG: hypothetical protein E7585_03315 [Ruminococcaceae bacterium]|nr:hypothetical protein [Oscillospiraceae bacterium]
MKRLFSALLCLLMLTPLIALLPFEAAAQSTVKFTVADKNGNATTTFVYGEPIMITPLVGEGADWIGIAPKGRVSYGSVRHKRIAAGSKDSRPGGNGLGLNVPFDLRTGAAVETRFAQYADIYPGDWTIFWCKGGGVAKDYDTTSTIDITVTKGPMTVNKTEFDYGEPILITAKAKENPTYKSWYGIVPDVSGAPKYSHGTIINRTADGTEDDLRDYSDALSGTVNNNTTKWAEYFGISKKQLLCLPAGTYWLVYCEDSQTVNGGASVTHKIQIKIKAAFTTNKSVYSYGEAINVNIGAGLEVGDHIFIAPKDPDLEVTYNSIRWQTLTAANLSAGSFNIAESKTTSNYPDLWNLPPGEYSLFVTYAPDGTAPKKNHGTRVDITISGDIPDAPIGITYTLKDKTTGSAGGRVTVSIDPNEVNDVYNLPTHVILYWGDENGKLADYTYISLYKVTGATVEIDLADVMVIPEEATRLMACCYNGAGVSEGLISVNLPADRTKVPDKGDLITSFQIVSDVHSQETQTHKYNQRIAQMLADIKMVDPNSVGIFAAGDSVNDGWVEEYENLYALWEQSGLSAPFFMATGNHEWKIGDIDNSYTSDYEREKDRFITYANKFLIAGGYEENVITNGKPYYDLWVNGFHYIFLASEAPITHAYFSDAQLSWLREKLAEDRDQNRPSFILLHQQLYNVVDGAMPIQDWDGVIAGDANYAAWKSSGVWKTRGLYEGPFREILSDFPEAMLFSGHSHWDMTDRHNIYDPDNPTDINDNPRDGQGNLLYTELLPNYVFNTASVAYLVSGVNDEAGLSYSNWSSSKGYYIRVYENCIEIWGRDFSTAQWVPNAMYRIGLDLSSCDHANTADCACVCKDCGDTLTPSEDHDTNYACDTHCKNCGEAVEHAAHTGEKICSTTCKYNCGTVLSNTPAHNIATPCTDTVCPVCNEMVIPVAHTGKKACSTICIYGCEIPLIPTQNHIGLHDCSVVCKNCGEPKLPESAHSINVYCRDTACYLCGATVNPLPHVGAYACSTVCKYGCGGVVTPTSEHDYGAWESVKLPTATTSGEQKHTCAVCHKVEKETLPPISENTTDTPNANNGTQTGATDQKDGNIGLVIGIVLGAVAVLGGAGFAVYWFVIKKRKT